MNQEELANSVQLLRATLLDSGWAHGRTPGEMTRDNLAVRTGFTMGGYRIVAFGRNRGSRSGQCYVDVTREWSKAEVRELTRDLVVASAQQWPPNDRMQPSVTGWGDGKP